MTEGGEAAVSLKIRVSLHIHEFTPDSDVIHRSHALRRSRGVSVVLSRLLTISSASPAVLADCAPGSCHNQRRGFILAAAAAARVISRSRSEP